MKTKSHHIRHAFSLLIPLILLSCSSFAGANTLSVQVQQNVDQLIKTNQCPDCNLAGADLNRLNLSGADLQRANLTGATFFLADLSGANLAGALLRGAQFGGADLADADLRGADLRGAALSGAYITGSKMDGTFVDVSISDDEDLKDITEKTFIPDDKKTKVIPDHETVSISDRRDFHQVPPVVDKSQIQTSKTVVSGSPSQADMQDAPPVKTISPVGSITIEEPKKVAIAKQQPDEIEPKSQVSSETKSKEDDGTAKTVAAEPDKMDLTETTIQEAAKPVTTNDQERLAGQEQILSSVSSTESQSDLLDASTEKENRIDANKTQAAALEAGSEAIAVPSQEHSSVTTKDVSQNVLKTAEDQVIEQKDMTSAEISESPIVAQNEMKTGLERDEKISRTDDSLESKTDDSSIEENPTAQLLEQLLDTNKCYRCNLSGVDLSGEDFEDADLEGTDFTGANLENVDFSEANLKGASFVNANLKNADFSKADLYKTNFSGADLTEADFSKAMVDEANFTGSRGYQSEMMDEKK